MRKDAAEAPVVDVAVRLAFQRFPVATTSGHPVPRWVGEVGDRREHFARTVFVVSGGGGGGAMETTSGTSPSASPTKTPG